MALHLHGMEVVQDVVHRRERAVARRVLVALPEDRAGRKIDFQTSVSRSRSPTSLGDGGFSFNAFPLSRSDGRSSAAWDAGTSAIVRRPRRPPAAARIVQGVRRAPVDAHRAARAGVVVHDEEGRVPLGAGGRRLGAFTMLRRQHVDAVPRADVLARPAQDAVVGVEHQVLRRLHALRATRGRPPRACSPRGCRPRSW